MLFLPSIIPLRTTRQKPFSHSVNCIKIFCKLVGHVCRFSGRSAARRISYVCVCVWLTTHQKVAHKFLKTKIFMLTKCILPNMENITLFTETTKIPKAMLCHCSLCVCLPVSDCVHSILSQFICLFLVFTSNYNGQTFWHSHKKLIGGKASIMIWVLIKRSYILASFILGFYFHHNFNSHSKYTHVAGCFCFFFFQKKCCDILLLQITTLGMLSSSAFVSFTLAFNILNNQAS